MTVTDEALVSDVRRCFPELELRSWRPLGEGWMNRALLINETHVFRFAKDADAAQDLAKEGALLPLIAARTSLRVPCFEFVGRQSSGLAFAGYPIIAGELLSPERFEALTSREQLHLAEQLSQLMTALQSIPRELCERAQLTAADHRNKCLEDRQALRQVYPQLAPGTRDYMEQRFDEFLNCGRFFDYTPRLIHADLSLDHLVWSNSARELLGVIDFGDLALADPDYEYLYLFEELGPEFTKQVMRLQRVADPDETLTKVGYYVTFDHVHVLLGGLKRGKEAWVGESIAALNAEAGEARDVT
jgi:aminoglycoside 2''-phosphotransferase